METAKASPAGKLLGQDAISLTPVGRVLSSLKEPSLKADGKDLAQMRSDFRAENSTISRVKVNPDLEPLLEGIEEFSHLLIIYWPHLLPVKARATQRVHPAGFRELPPIGVFASLSPARPNPLLATVVELLGREGSLLTIRGLEAVDQSPVLDIKPYNPHYLQRSQVRLAAWMNQLNRLFARMAEEDAAGKGAPR